MRASVPTGRAYGLVTRRTRVLIAPGSVKETLIYRWGQGAATRTLNISVLCTKSIYGWFLWQEHETVCRKDEACTYFSTGDIFIYVDIYIRIYM